MRSNTRWIDVEDSLPPIGELVMVFIPFESSVHTDRWTEKGWSDSRCYVSHWQRLDPPGTYAEIMKRPRGTNVEEYTKSYEGLDVRSIAYRRRVE